MSLNDQMIVCALLLIPLIIILRVLYCFYFRAKRDDIRYKFFAFRDNLLWLVAVGKISEDNYVFGELYSLTNKIVNHTEALSFSNLVRYLKADFDSSDRSKKLKEEIEKIHDKKVHSVLAGFSIAVLQAMRGNSFLFRVMERLITFGFIVRFKMFPPIAIFFKFIFRDLYSAYKIRKEVSIFTNDSRLKHRHC